jgi:hypothetical protein
MRNGERVLRRGTEGRMPLHQGDAEPSVSRLRRVSARHRSPLSRRRNHPPGTRQPLDSHPQGGDGPVRRRGRWLAVEPVHDPPHPKTRTLAQSGRDRNRTLQQTVSRQANNLKHRRTHPTSRCMEPAHQPSQDHHRLDLRTEESQTQTKVQTHAVAILYAVLFTEVLAPSLPGTCRSPPRPPVRASSRPPEHPAAAAW